MVINLLCASKIEGAPSQPYLFKMTRDSAKFPFLRDTKDGWRVDTDDPAWAEYLERRLAKPAARIGGAAERGAEKTSPPVKAKEKRKPVKKAPEAPGSGNLGASEITTIQEAYAFQVIQKAQKAEIDKRKAELELSVMEGRYIEKARMVYLMGYFQRAVTEGLDDIKRGGINSGAVKQVCDKLKEHFARTIDILQKEEGIVIGGEGE